MKFVSAGTSLYRREALLFRDSDAINCAGKALAYAVRKSPRDQIHVQLARLMPKRLDRCAKWRQNEKDGVLLGECQLTHAEGQPISSKIGKLDHSLKTYGFSKTLVRTLRFFLLKLDTWHDVRFDRKHRVQTTETVHVSALGLPKDHEKHSENYEPAPLSVIKRTIESIPYDLKDFAFIDVGCGKGRVLFVAAEYDFSQIIGIELSKDMHDQCAQNIQGFKMTRQKCHAISSRNENALDFVLPDENIALFMFNPFSEAILAPFLDRLKRHQETTGKKTVIMYYYPKHQSLIYQDDRYRVLPYLEPLLHISISYRWPVSMFETVG